MKNKLLVISILVLTLLFGYQLLFMKGYPLSKGLLYIKGVSIVVGILVGSVGMLVCKAIGTHFLYRKTEYYKKDQEWSI